METGALNQRDRAANDDEPLNPGKLRLLHHYNYCPHVHRAPYEEGAR